MADSIGVLVLVLSIVQLIVGMVKTSVAPRLGKKIRYECGLAMGLVLEIGLFVAVSILTIRKVHSEPGADLEWKLLAGAAAVDAIYLLWQAAICALLAETTVDDKKKHNRRTRFFITVTVIAICLLGAPLIIHFFRTNDENKLVFSIGIERRLVISLVSISAIAAILMCLTLVLALWHSKIVTNTLFATTILSLPVAPLLLSFGMSIYGMISTRKSVLLATLLVLVPPSASYTFVWAKTFVLDEWGEHDTGDNTIGENEKESA